MNTENIKETEEKTEASRNQAANEAKDNSDNKTIHTVNPFTGTEIEITPEDLEGIEKKIEADTERD